MGFLDELKKLTWSYDEDEDEFEDFTPPPTVKERPQPKQRPVSQQQQPRPTAKAPANNSNNAGGFERSDNKVVNIHATAQLQVVLVKPEQFENAAEIADHLREKRTVVLNLEQTNKAIACRLIDFLSGVAYAQDGKIKKIAVNTYLITPYNVVFMGDLIDELENNGLYF